MRQVKNEEHQKVLQEFAQTILDTVDLNRQNGKKSYENLIENSSDFGNKFREYEEEIEKLKKENTLLKNSNLVLEKKTEEVNIELNEERELTVKLMKKMNELTENGQIELESEREEWTQQTQVQINKKEELLQEMRVVVNEYQEKEKEWELNVREKESRISALELRVGEYKVNSVRKNEYELMITEKLKRENEFSELENQLAIETTKTGAYETQIEKLKNAIRGSNERELRQESEIDELKSRVLILGNEIKQFSIKRKTSLNLQEDNRVSGNLDIEESAYASIYFSKAEDDVSRRIEEMEKRHQESQNQSKDKIKIVMEMNENLNNEILRLKEEKNSVKGDSMFSKRSSVMFSQREISKSRKGELSEEMMEKMLSGEILNKKLTEENRVLHKKITEINRYWLVGSELVYSCALGYLR